MNTIWMWGSLGALLAATMLAYGLSRPKASSRDDRYTAELLLTPPQAELLEYLQTAFPDQAVLANVPLRTMVSVRSAASRQRARDRLERFVADFVVCDENGKAAFVFDVEAYRAGDTRSARQEALVKNRILKSAGIRLIYIKETSRKMPSPNDFRQKLSLAALVPRVDPRQSALQDLEHRIAKRDRDFKPSEFRESEVMGLSRLMGLNGPPSGVVDPWGRGE